MKTFYLLLPAMLLCAMVKPRFLQADRIYGVWQSDTINGLSAEMKIEPDGNGIVKWSDDTQPYRFRFERINDSVVIFKSGRLTTKHKIGKLTDERLRLRPFDAYQKSVEIIDNMEFIRKK